VRVFASVPRAPGLFDGTTDPNVASHLLLIDDDLRLTDMVGDYLRRNGFEVEHRAASLGSGRDLLRRPATTPCCWT
jgi:hypothetical protein